MFFYRKHITVNICDDEEYEKTVVFYLELGEPKLFRTAAGNYYYVKLQDKHIGRKRLKCFYLTWQFIIDLLVEDQNF